MYIITHQDLPKGIPPRIEDVKIYFNQRGLSEAEAECFFFLYEGRQWKNRNGQYLKKWKSIAFNWIAGVFRKEPWRFNKYIH